MKIIKLCFLVFLQAVCKILFQFFNIHLNEIFIDFEDRLIFYFIMYSFSQLN